MDSTHIKYADRRTSFIENQWYVVAWRHEIKRDLLPRCMLSQDLLRYRSEYSDPIILQNRCANRFFPLPEGYLDGDNVL